MSDEYEPSDEPLTDDEIAEVNAIGDTDEPLEADDDEDGE